MGQSGNDKNKNKDKDEEGFVVYSYDPPLPGGEPTQKEFDEQYKNDPEYRKLVHKFLSMR